MFFKKKHITSDKNIQDENKTFCKDIYSYILEILVDKIKNCKMKWFHTFAVVIFIPKYGAIPLQGFGTDDQTTGSKWPPHENTGN